MGTTFKAVAIIGRQTTAGIHHTLTTLIEHLHTKKITVYLEQETASLLANNKLPTLNRDQLSNRCELIIVVGGDGSILSAARVAAPQKLPVIGINRGYLGFLTDISPDNIAKIDAMLAGEFISEHRFLLSCALQTKNHKATQNLALNDVVLLSATTGNMIEFSVYVDERFLCSYRADGLIVTTPTGSTGHALSAGGPILHPTLEAIAIVPMLSHNLSSRSIVIKSDSVIKIIFAETNTTSLLVRCDGQIQSTLNAGEVIVQKAQNTLRLLHPIDYDYFETLRTKLHWETK